MTLVTLTPGALGTKTTHNGKPYVVTNRKDRGITVFGPYETRPAGRYTVRFDVSSSDHESLMGDPVCLHVDIVTNEGNTIIREKFVTVSQLSDASNLTVGFELHEPRAVEYRVWTEGQIALTICAEVNVERTGDISRLAVLRSPEQVEWQNEREFLDGYLRNVTGLIHVGANLGQERRYYWLIGLDVIWVEPIREIYDRLVDNISAYPRQRAFNALLTSRRGEQVEFGIANNNGASSSILPLEDHAVLWPDIVYAETRIIESTTLVDLIDTHHIPLDEYQALTLDVEGAEKMILEGSLAKLRRFKYIKCEAADFPARKGTPTARELNEILEAQGFRELSRRSFALGPNDEGTYWDIVWKRTAPGHPLHEPGVGLPLIMNPMEVDGIEKCE